MENQEKCVVWVEPFNQLEICRVCLKGPSNLCDIKTHGLSDVFNTFVDLPKWCSDKLPKYICEYCRSMLLKCVDFKSKCRRICSYFYEGNWEKDLTVNNELKTRLKKLKISDVEVIDWGVPEEEANPTKNHFNDSDPSDTVNFKSEYDEEIKSRNQIFDDDDFIIGQQSVIEEVPIDIKDVSTYLEDIFVDEISVGDDGENKDSKNELTCKRERECENGNIEISVAQHSSNELIPNSTLKINDLLKNCIIDEKLLNSNKNFSSKSKEATTIKCTKESENISLNKVIDENSDSEIQDDISVDSEERFLDETENKINEIDEKGLQSNKPAINTKRRSKNEKTDCIKTIKNPERSKYLPIQDYAEFSKMYELEIINLTKEQHLEFIRKRKMDIESGKAKFRFNCNICYKGFLSEAAFKNHSRSHDSELCSFKCDICYMCFATKSTLRSHMTKHRKQYVCKICKNVTTNPSNAKQHYLVKHQGKILECAQCFITFSTYRTRENHIRKFHKAVKCDICQENIIGASNLLRHKRDVHGGLDVVICAKCKVRFRNSASYDLHKVVCEVTSGRQFCSVCGDGFENDDVLQSHMKEKHDKKGFNCHECPASFKSDYLLANHWTQKHSVVVDADKVAVARGKRKNFMCEVCGMSYHESHKLKCHLLRHTEPRPFKCTECEKAFKSPVQLKAHSVKHIYNDMPNNKDAKPFKCDLCPKVFKTLGGRSRHRMEHVTPADSLRPHLCSLCGKRFKQKPHLAAHIWTHTREKPFACTVCEKRYRCPTSLAEHMDTVHRGLPPRRRMKRKHEENDGE